MRLRSLGALVLLLGGAVIAAQAEDWPTLARRCTADLRGVRSARILQEPAAVLAAESAYAATLDSAAAFARDHAPADSAAEVVWCHLLADRRRELLGVVCSQWESLDSLGVARFFAGLAAYESERFALAAEIFAAPGPAYLRAQGEFLHLRALEEAEDPRAGPVALSLAQSGPEHPFHDAAVLRAARYLLEEGEEAPLTALLERWLTRLPAQSALAAAAHTLLAEAASEKGKRRALVREFRAAEGWRGMPPEEVRLRLEQARRLLHGGRRLTPEDLNACCAIVIREGGSREAWGLWERYADRLPVAERPVRARELLERFYAMRLHDETREIARQLHGTPEEQRMWLILGRTARREGDLAKLASAYGAAAVGESAEIAEQALWEWGRELEDARAWPPAAECFARLAAEFPRGEHAKEARLRRALCRYRAGDLVGGLADLQRNCEQASARTRGGPCLWRALRGEASEREFYLSRAAGEERPGYHALRASVGADRTSAQFWQDLTEEIAAAASWNFPATGAQYDRERADRILGLCEGNPLADAGWLLLAFGYQSWARGLWEHLPGRQALAIDERAALSRALGDFPRAIFYGGRTDALAARYPVGFAHEIAVVAGAESLSPAFLLAVMRQESLLSPSAHSRVGAIGLMQLMPGTARRLADSLAIGDYELERPADNVRFGAAHLAELWRAYEGAVPMVLAAYNAGRPHAERWLDGRTRETSDWDEYIEQITFAETRKFVKSVLMHYWSIRAAHRSP